MAFILKENMPKLNGNKHFIVTHFLTLFILMDYSINIDTISMALSLLYFKGFQVKISIKDVFPTMKIVFILASSADPDEMQFYSAFHL